MRSFFSIHQAHSNNKPGPGNNATKSLDQKKLLKLIDLLNDWYLFSLFG